MIAYEEAQQRFDRASRQFQWAFAAFVGSVIVWAVVMVAMLVVR